MDRQIARMIRCNRTARTVLLASSMLAGTAQAATLPVGGTVAAGTATISAGATTTTINQSSARAVIDWTSFSVGQGDSVVFNQAGAQSATLNRVTGSVASTIAGQIKSNGAVYLVNPNGIAITSTGVVNTAGGFVAATLNIADADFMAGKLNFTGGGSSASVTNAGSITAGKGAYVALLGGQVSNSGTIAVPLGSVGLGSGEQVALDINGGGFLQVAVPTSALSGSSALITNAGAIKAGGGTVILSAATLKSLVRNVINMSGSINADSAVGNGGTIELLGGAGGTVVAGGTLSARATGTTGNGGSIETSGQTVNANGLTVNTTSAHGTVGTWSIDPTNFTIAATGGDITGAELSTNLAASNVTIQSSSGASGTNGDINVNDTITWSTGNTLSLSAYRNVNFNTTLTATGADAGLVLQADNTGTGTGTVIFASGVQANLTGANSFANVFYNAPVFGTPVSFVSTTNASNVTTGITAGTLTAYELVNTLTELQNINKNLSENYALGTNIDATATATENSNAGFIPLGTNGAGAIAGSYGFTGSFDGLGHTITNLTIARSTRLYVGLFGYVTNINTNASITNVSLVNVKVAGNQDVGGLVGEDASSNYGDNGYNFTNDSVSGAVTASNYSSTIAGNVGGLIGAAGGGGTYSQLSSTATVTGSSTSASVGGLIGSLGYGTGRVSTLTGLVASGAVTGGSYVGGLIGDASSAVISTVSATGNVTGSNTTTGALANYVGGLIGYATSDTITGASATGTVTATGYTNDVGGLIGISNSSSLTNVSATGNVTGNAGSNSAGSIGGLIGNSSASTITGASAIGAVSATGNVSYLGGLIGYGGNDSITNSYAKGAVTGNYGAGGLVGFSSDETIAGSYASGNITGTTYAVSGTTYAPTYIGGLAGYIASGSITGSYATGTVSGNQYVGGLAGFATSTPITSSYATGAITGSTYTLSAEVYTANSVGGLVGYQSSGDINNSSASGAVSAAGAATNLGGLVGQSYYTNINNSSATGNVTGGAGSSSVGGLVGNTGSGYNGDQVTYSNASGTVTGSSAVGGLLGTNYDQVISSTATGAVAQIGIASTTTTTYSYSGIGGLIGNNSGNVVQSSASGNVTVGSAKYGVTSVGGLIGSNSGQVTQSYAGGTVNAGANSSYVGGLDGYDTGSILQSSASGAVTGAGWTGGLAGYASSISQSMAWGAVTGLGTANGQIATGGLVGYSTGSINASYANGNVSETAINLGDVGGLVGNNQASITQSYAIGTVTSAAGSSNVGGLVGLSGGAITQSYATGAVTAGAGSSSVGGLAGFAQGGSITQSYATGAVTATSAYNTKGVVTTASTLLGGLVGNDNYSPITQSFATGNVTGDNGSTYVGGLIGYAYSASINQAYASGNVSIGAYSTALGSGGYVGGLAGYANGNINDAYATGAVTSGAGNANVGGLIGYLYANLNQAYAAGKVTGGTGSTSVGGLIGDLASGTIIHSLWDTTATGQTLGLGTGTSGGAVGYTTAQMQNFNTYGTVYAGWNFTTTWSPPTAAGQAGQTAAYYPELYALTPVVVANPTSASRTYGAANPTFAGSVIGGGTSTYELGPVGDSLSTGALFSTIATVNSGVGTYAITSAINGAQSAKGVLYRVITPTSALLTINPAALTLTYTANAASAVYGSALPTLTGAVTATGLVAGDTLTSATTGTAAWTTTAANGSNVGSYGITGSGLSAANYTITAVQAAGNAKALSITPAPLTITYTANPLSRVYGAVNPSLSGSVTASGLVNGNTLAGVTTGTAGWTTTAGATSGVGSYAVNGSGLTAKSGNYTFDFVQAAGNATALTITPASLTITYTATATSQTYGSTPAPTGTVSATGLVNTDTLAGVTSGTAVWTTPATVTNGVGSYAVTGSGLTGATGNYIFNFIQSPSNIDAYTIIPAPLTLTYTATAVSRLYGSANPTVTGTIVATGLENTDTVAGVTTGTATWSTTAAKTNNVGGYAITGTGLVADSANYDITFAQAAGNATALSITPAPLTLTYTATAASKVYGAAVPTLTGTVAATGLVNGDTLATATAKGTATWTTTATSASSVGSYAITGGGLSASNYTISVVQAANNAKALTITAAPVTITYTASAASRIYGNTNPTLMGSVSVSGLVNGDTLTTITKGTAIWASTATTASSVGSYAINGAGLSANSTNYKYTWVQAANNATALTVTPRALTLTPVAISQTYGSAIPTTDTATAAAKTTTSGLVNGDTVGSIAVSTTATSASGVGSYALTGSAAVFSSGSAGNYNITYAASPAGLTITAAPLVITYNANPATMTAGSAVPTLSGSIGASGLENGDLLANILAGTAIWTTTATSASAAGSYAITGSGLSANSANYKFTFVQAAGNSTALTIN